MFNELKQYAKDHHIPIIYDDGLLFLKQLITSHNVKDVLEIGTAIGYSALQMASFGCHVDTFERDPNLVEIAKENIKNYGYENQIKVIEHDALHPYHDLGMYDLIFIDAAKAQYQKFFEIYQAYLKPNGMIVCDNLSFHHLKKEDVNRHTKQLLGKIERFKQFLVQHEDFITEFDDIGDGMSVSKRRNR
ncbi:MAG: O-methyltransferase [Acholeplasmataceae bacterium]|nr:O-methyltransferase [Acholeplasmataceae bacterium]MDD4194294.1 O-methyltransferase [Acholeplasmataceae bacterium]